MHTRGKISGGGENILLCSFLECEGFGILQRHTLPYQTHTRGKISGGGENILLCSFLEREGFGISLPYQTHTRGKISGEGENIDKTLSHEGPKQHHIRSLIYWAFRCHVAPEILMGYIMICTHQVLPSNWEIFPLTLVYFSLISSAR
jgi:hypothetical protein